VNEAATGPASRLASENTQDPSGEKNLHEQIQRSHAQDHGVERDVASPAGTRRGRLPHEQTRGQGTAQEKVQILEGETNAQNLRMKGFRPSSLSVKPLAPPREVEAVEHVGRGIGFLQVLLQPEGEWHRQERCDADVHDEDKRDETKAAS